MKEYGVSIKWLAVASFEMKLGKKTVVTDPFITECVGTDLDWTAVENCDFITLTHAHWDHVTDIPRLYEKFAPKILAGEMSALEIARWLNAWPSGIYPMYPGTELDFGAFKVKALYGRHNSNNKWGIRSYMEERAPHVDVCKNDPYILKMQEIGSFEYRNYLFTLPNGTKILMWGSAATPEQIAICKAEAPDIAIIQRSAISRAAKRADFAAAIGAKVVIPHHHDFHGKDDPAIIEAFRDAYLERVPDGKFITPVHGEWIHL